MTTINLRPAVVTIDLSALDHNIKVIKKYAKSAKIIPVIKSDAYGHGIIEIANHIKTKVDALAVSNVKEALLLRENDIKIPIVALLGFTNLEGLNACQRNNIYPVIHDNSQIEILKNTPLKDLKVWIKFDTGMGRLGFLIDDSESIYQQLNNINNLEINCIMSHLSDANDLQSSKNTNQNKLFTNLLETKNHDKSLLNSGGLLNEKLLLFNWVRIGLMMYGISPIKNKTAQDYNLKPVMQLTAPIIAIKRINKGSTVGYGSTWVCPKDMDVAIVAIGYGDGFIRSLSGSTILVAGKYRPIIGQVSMDSIAINISDCKCQIGDQIQLWGQDNLIEQMANKAGTIPYELLCLVSKINHEYIN